MELTQDERLTTALNARPDIAEELAKPVHDRESRRHIVSLTDFETTIDLMWPSCRPIWDSPTEDDRRLVRIFEHYLTKLSPEHQEILRGRYYEHQRNGHGRARQLRNARRALIRHIALDDSDFRAVEEDGRGPGRPRRDYEAEAVAAQRVLARLLGV